MAHNKPSPLSSLAQGIAKGFEMGMRIKMMKEKQRKETTWKGIDFALQMGKSLHASGDKAGAAKIFNSIPDMLITVAPDKAQAEKQLSSWVFTADTIDRFTPALKDLQSITNQLNKGKINSAEATEAAFPIIGAISQATTKENKVEMDFTLSEFRGAQKRQLEKQETQRGEAQAQAKTQAGFESLLGTPPTPEAQLTQAKAPQGQKVPISPDVSLTGELPALPGVTEKPEQPSLVSPLSPEKRNRIAPLADIGTKEALTKALGIASEKPPKPIVPKTPDIFKQESTLRGQFSSASKEFGKITSSYGRILASGTDPSAAGDLALIFNYMKMLDPGSVVRESEFATAAATGSWGERLKAAGAKIARGERLSPVQRTDFMSRSKKLFGAADRKQKSLEKQYTGIAKRNNLDPANIIIDFRTPSAQPVTQGTSKFKVISVE